MQRSFYFRYKLCKMHTKDKRKSTRCSSEALPSACVTECDHVQQ